MRTDLLCKACNCYLITDEDETEYFCPECEASKTHNGEPIKETEEPP